MVSLVLRFWQVKLSSLDVGLPGEVGEVLVNLPEPDLGANHAW